MLSSRFTLRHLPLFLAKYAWLTVRRRPMLVHFEVTMRCNARCGFCDYWKSPASEKEKELRTFSDAARFFNPMIVTFTGGEPLLRQDLEDVVASVYTAIPVTWLTVITHGAMLTPERARGLWAAGISQISISLDYLDGRHDTARGIPRLTEKILSTVDALRGSGITLRFNTVIKNDNLDQMLPIVERAQEVGVGVNFSVYTDFKNGNRDYLVQNGHVAAAEEVIAELLAYKRRRRGVISNSDYYLAQIPRYLRGESMNLCRSGMRTIHIDPTGQMKRCPDFPVDSHWSQFGAYQPIACNACFYACRGEAEAPLTWSRVLDIVGSN